MTANPFDNQEFRKELTELLETKLTPLATKVEEHEAVINKSKGAIVILGGIWTLIVGGAEYLFHRHS